MLKSQGLIVTGRGNGNPLQYSWLENPVDRGACQAIVHSVAKSQTWLKWLNITIIITELIAILCVLSTLFRWSISASLFLIPYYIKPLNCLWWLWQNFSHMSFLDQYVMKFSFSHSLQFQVYFILPKIYLPFILLLIYNHIVIHTEIEAVSKVLCGSWHKSTILSF